MKNDEETKIAADAALSDEHRLLVPICVEALVVGKKSTATWTDQSPDYSQIEVDWLGKKVAPPLFNEFFDGRKREKTPSGGIHLHWALPAALTHGTQRQAMATAIVQDGVVKRVTITNGGGGYTKAPAVRLTGGDGSGATAVAEVKDGVVSEVKIIHGGRGYTEPPTVDIQASDVIEYPLVPNRWLVSRISSPSGAKEMSIKAWIVESDYLDQHGGTNSWIVRYQGLTTYEVTRLGRAVDLGHWTETEPSNALFLMAVGPGNPAFAASYQSCRNVFGFHDDLSGAAPGQYTYLVAGWYSDPSKDPLHGIKTAEEWKARMQELQWSVPEHTDALPTRILCHGMIHSVAWKGPDNVYPLRIPATQAEVAVGNTPMEALAALIDAKIPETQRRDVELLLGIFQYGLLKKNSFETVRMVRRDQGEREGVWPLDHFRGINEGIHGEGFGKLPGGSLWEIQKKEKSEPISERNDTQPTKPLPPDLAELLEKINERQRDCDRSQRDLAELGWQLYANWYQQRYLRYPAPGTSMPKDKEELDRAISERITELKEDIRMKQAHLNSLLDKDSEASIPAIQQKIEEAWKQSGGDLAYAWLKDYILVASAMPHFYQPYDPVVLLYGVKPSKKHGELEQSGMLSCRISGQAIDHFKVEIGGSENVDVSKKDIENLNSAQNIYTFPQPHPLASIPKELEALFLETLFLDPGRTELIARVHYAMNGIADPSPKQVAELGKRLREALEKKEAVQYGRTSPARSAASSWEQAWTPLFMAWEVNWYPYCRSPEKQEVPDSEEQQIPHSWHLDNGIDTIWNHPRSDPDCKNPITYRGYVPLSPHLTQVLMERRNKFPDQDFLFKALEDARLLSQSLSGLNDAMIMRESTLQFPALKEGSLEIDEDIASLVGDHYCFAPMPDSPGDGLSTFSPIRGGHLEIRRLWVVDAFGQVKKVIDPLIDEAKRAPLHISRSLAATKSNLVHLPSRLAQPARLLFRWRSAEDDTRESSIDPQTQPICGWIISNRLEHSLIVYNARGNELGAVRSVDDPAGWRGKAIRWSKPPWVGPDGEAPLGTATTPTEADISNAHLRKFVLGLLQRADENGRARDRSFSDFLDLLDEMENYIQPAGLARQTLSILIGRPLALVRASLQLELDGPPATDLGWSQSGRWNPRGFTRVKFPVRLGDMGKGRDGLIGYFVGDDYQTIRLTDGTPRPEGKENGYFKYDADIPLTCHPGAEPVMVTLLMDPQAGMHIRSGILPLKYMELPPYGVSEALSAMDITFLTAPVIAGPETPSIPLPSDIHGEWLWISRAKDGKVNEARAIGKGQEKTPSLFGPIHIHEGWLKLHSDRKGAPDRAKDHRSGKFLTRNYGRSKS